MAELRLQSASIMNVQVLTCTDSKSRTRFRPLRKSVIIGLLLLFVLSIAEDAFAVSRSTANSKSTVRKKRFKRVRALFRWNPVLRGSRDSLLRQNLEIDRLQLPRIQDEYELEQLKLREELVAIPATSYLRFDAGLDPERRYAKAWTRDFVGDLGRAFYAEFRRPIQVNSAVRTVENQRRLRRRNRNAAPIEGDTASSHLAGLTVDIAKRGLTRKQHKWLVEYLKPLRDQGLIEAAEERRQACFHIMVYERYGSWREENVVAGAGTEQAQQGETAIESVR